MNYILIVDDEEDIRDILEMVLKRSFPLDVLTAKSGKEALNIVKQRGKPEIIISDLKMPDGDGAFLYKSIKDNDWSIPFVICTTEVSSVLKKTFPDIHGFIEKPNIIAPAVELVGSIVNKMPVPPEFVPVRISLLLRWGIVNYDLYMKLSDTRFVKVINAGEAFLAEDAERFTSKGVDHLHITSGDADAYLKALESNISMLLSSESKPSSELSVITLESLEVVERIGKAIGWTPAVLSAAKNAVELATKVVSNEPNLLKLLKNKINDPHSKFSTHVSTLSLIACGLCHNLRWVSESTQMKLGLAALMHDLLVDESYYVDINYWNEAASALKDKNEDVLRYRNHPAEGANLVLTMKNVPSEVDQIILQHHETKDGGGFPRGLISSRILPLTCVFIITEDLINFVEGADDYEERVDEYLKLREEKYNSGNFKKVFDSFKASVEKSRLRR